jgi:hypothetical protein
MPRKGKRPTPHNSHAIDPNLLYDLRDLARAWGWNVESNSRPLREAIEREMPGARIYELGHKTYLVNFRGCLGPPP